MIYIKTNLFIFKSNKINNIVNNTTIVKWVILNLLYFLLAFIYVIILKK